MTIRTLAVVKPARGTAIRFLGSATARPLEADRLRSALLHSALHRLFTRTERCLIRIVEFNISMFRFVLLCQFSILFEIAVASLFLFCLKLKSNIFKRIFQTKGLSYVYVRRSDGAVRDDQARPSVVRCGGALVGDHQPPPS